MTFEIMGSELMRAYGEGLRDFSEANLRGADLRGANLSEADLRGANLHGADLRGANLRGVNLVETNLRDADLSGSNLFESDLSRADLRGTNLHDANLHNCDGLYSAYSPFMSSRRDAIYAGIFERGVTVVLLFTADCKPYRTADEMRALVATTHGDNAYAAQYNAAITFIEACFASDLASGRFDVITKRHPRNKSGRAKS